MRRSEENIWLNRYAWLTAIATLVLICFGGLVTSHGAGLAVPDWPNSYGYNMFLFPASQWLFTKNGIFYEHSHRLVASGVGAMTTILALWIWLKESRSWVRWMGVGAFLMVVIQGILGGLRVTLLSDGLGLVHGALAQIFFALTSSIALVTSRFWTSRSGLGPIPRVIPKLFLAVTALVFLQLLLGAGMRHRHAGLAVPDFPLAYGKVWPETDTGALNRYNRLRLESAAAQEIEAIDVNLHMAHRLLGLVVLCSVIVVNVAMTRRALGGTLTLGARAWLALVLAQVGLGIWTVLSGKAADVATAHVAVGSMILTLGCLLSLLAFLSASETTMEKADSTTRCSEGSVGEVAAAPVPS